MIRMLVIVPIIAVMLSSGTNSPAQQAAAQNPIHNMSFPAVTAQHRALSAMVGDWAITGQTHKGCPYGEGTFTGTEHNEFMDGGMFLVSRTQYSSLFKNSSQISFFGVDPNTKEYTYAIYSSLGIVVQATGNLRNKERSALLGNAIEWTEKKVNVDMHADQPTVVYRTEVVSPTEYKFGLVSNGILWYEGSAKLVKRVNPR